MGAVDILRLKPAFNDEQAEALARLIDENLATKRDIAEVKRDIAELRTDLKRDVEALRTDLKRDVEELRVELKRDIESLRTGLTATIDGSAKDLRVEIERVRWDVARWVVGMGLATIGVLFALIRFFV